MKDNPLLLSFSESVLYSRLSSPLILLYSVASVSYLYGLCLATSVIFSISATILIILTLTFSHSVESVSYSWRPWPATSTLCKISIIFLKTIVLLLLTLCSIRSLFPTIHVLLLQHPVASVSYYQRSSSCYNLHSVTSVYYIWEPLPP